MRLSRRSARERAQAPRITARTRSLAEVLLGGTLGLTLAREQQQDLKIFLPTSQQHMVVGAGPYGGGRANFAVWVGRGIKLLCDCNARSNPVTRHERSICGRRGNCEQSDLNCE